MRETSGNWDLSFDVPMSYKLGLEVLQVSTRDVARGAAPVPGVHAWQGWESPAKAGRVRGGVVPSPQPGR